jgi:predicted acyl esterase
MRRLAVIVAVLAGLALAVPPAPADAESAPRWVGITARDGVRLGANVVEPSTPGPHPGIVFISSWGANDTEYLAQATVLARRGYVVLSYAPRGFGGSGGHVEVAGPADVTDVTDALDWMVAHTSVDPDRIGVGGISYGAGIGLIASGHDPRIRAVLAMSGWTDLVESLYSGQTRRLQTVGFLGGVAALAGRPSPELQQVLADYFANRDIAGVTAWARVRGAATYVDRINAHAPAIFLANAYGDSIFGPNQLVDFYGRLTGPKRLELAPGDHGMVEATGLAGLPNHVWAGAHRWLDRYVAGASTPIPDAVVLRSRTTPSVLETYGDWGDVSGRSVTYALNGPGALTTRTVPVGWERTITSGVPTTADAGVVMLSNGLEALTGVPPLVSLPTVSRLHAGVWTTDRLAEPAAIRGAARLRLTARQRGGGTVVAYLYDVDALGTGRLVGHAPVTWRTDGPLDVRFPATSYDVPAGHRVALVVDTVDPLYLDAGPLGAPLVFGGRSTLDLPLR